MQSSTFAPSNKKDIEMSEQKKGMPFNKSNYRIMLIGIGLIALGYIVMSLETEQHGFGFLGLTLGPIILMSGFMIQFWALLKKNKTEDTPESN